MLPHPQLLLNLTTTLGTLLRRTLWFDFHEVSPLSLTLVFKELDEVSPAELCCHTLLIDDGSRHRSYCLLLLSHVDVDEADLRAQAAKYGLEDEIDAYGTPLEGDEPPVDTYDVDVEEELVVLYV